ncbi:MAG: hypothetical protein RLY71_420 [Pseudomonadota bacterium]|jgi:hypothetical protein
MTARNLGVSFAAALQADHVRLFPLVEIGFASGTQYLCGLDFPVTWSGNTYQPALGLIDIEAIRETAESFEGIKLTISGVTSASLGSAMSERMQGRPLTLRMAVLDAANALQVDINCWSGLMDAPLISDDPNGSATVTLVAEHRMATWDRPRTKRYTDAQLQADFPGDLGLQYIAQMEQQRIVWPRAEFFKQ